MSDSSSKEESNLISSKIGRPRKVEKNLRKRVIPVRFSEEEYEQLIREAGEQRITTGALIRKKSLNQLDSLPVYRRLPEDVVGVQYIFR